MIKASIPMLRRQMELAGILCKNQMAFVIVPVTDDADYETLLRQQQERLEAIAKEAEQP